MWQLEKRIEEIKKERERIEACAPSAYEDGRIEKGTFDPVRCSLTLEMP